MESAHGLLNHPQGELESIVKTLHKLNRLREILETVLPKKIFDHCQVSHLAEGKLYLVFDHASVASQFHFQKFEYLSQLRKIPEFAGLSQIQHRVDPLLKKAPPPPPKFAPSLQLPQPALESLEQLILHSEGALKANLEKLRARLKQNDGNS